jgi:hypothetical protein
VGCMVVAGNTRIQSLLNFFLNQIVICYCFFQVFERCHIFKGSLNYLYVLKFCPAFWRRDINMYLVFSAFTSRPDALLASCRGCVFFFMLSMSVFLNRRAAARYLALASIIPNPRLIEIRIYRAAV